MVVGGRIDFVEGKLQQGYDIFISIGHSVQSGRDKIKIVIGNTPGLLSENARITLVATLAMVKSLVASSQCVDRAQTLRWALVYLYMDHPPSSRRLRGPCPVTYK